MIQSKVPTRLFIAIAIFVCLCMNYMMRVNLSMNLVAMVPVGNQTYNSSKTTLDWTAYERAQVLRSFFWGYMLGNLIGGTLAEIFGSKIIVSIVITFSSILTLLSPAAAKYSYLALMIVRIILGLFSGIEFPTLHVLVSKWAVSAEKGRFLGALLGGTIGTFISWTLCGIIIEPWGWEWGFYIFGIIGLVWLVISWFVIYDAPDKHPRISDEEIRYIQEGSKNAQTHKQVPPFFKIFSSVPFWSLCFINFGTGWGIYFVITAGPNYISAVLDYGISSTGLLSAFIYLVRSSCAIAFGHLGDYILKRNFMTVKVLRNVACIVSHVIPGFIILCMTIPDYEPIFYAALIIIAMGFNGSTPHSSMAIPHDLSKNFAGTLSGFGGVMTAAAGIISPFVTAYFTQDDQTNQKLWTPVFYTGGLIYILTGLQYLVIGSVDKQPWDKVPENDTDKENNVLD